jgi:uncharacterized protein YecE (DUF72 family)
MAKDSGNKRQTHLFGKPAPRRPRAVVASVEPSSDQRRLARELPRHIHLGTSSWSFPGWAGLVYDRGASKSALARSGLAAYAEHPLLRAVGIDRTYYAPIDAAAFADYAAAVPDDFRFLVKAPADCTSPALRDESGRYGEANPRFLDAEYATRRIVEPVIEGLGAKTGTVLFQFPPLGRSRGGDAERFADALGSFLLALPAGPLYSVELRDRRLFGEPYLAALDASGARHCFNRHPRMPPIADQLRTVGGGRPGPTVVRWMLNSARDYASAVERYEPFSRLVDEDPVTRETLSELCADPGLDQFPIVIIANNKAEGSAPLTIFELARSIVRRLGDPAGS